MKCKDCNGRGKIKLFSSIAKCEPCEGTGTIPKDASFSNQDLPPKKASIGKSLQNKRKGEKIALRSQRIKKRQKFLEKKAKEIIDQLNEEYPNASDSFIRKEALERLEKVDVNL